jgi:hypothetical protein
MLIFALLISFLLTLLGLALSDHLQEKVSDSIKYRMKNKKQLFKANIIYKKYVKDITILKLSITKDNYFDIISLQLNNNHMNINDNFDLELFIDDFEPVHSSWLFFKKKPNYVKKIVINNQILTGKII